MPGVKSSKCSFLLEAFFCIWLFTEADSGKLTRRETSNPIFVEIKPDIFQSKNVIKIEALEKRPKRDKADENPSLVLEFNSGFFSNPKLKELYDAITGANEFHRQISFTKSKLAPPEETKMILQFNPLKTGEIGIKREAPIKSRKDMGGFVLKIYPHTSQHTNPIRMYNDSCADKEPDEQWCSNPTEVPKCPVTCPTIPTTTTCHPTIPPVTTKKLHFCGPNYRDHRSSAQPCQVTVSTIMNTTEYIPCKSSPPPSIMPEWGPATIGTCKYRTTTSLSSLEETTNALITQKCRSSQQNVNEHLAADRYFILFKRSPLDSWSKVLRKKRDRPLGIFKFKLVPTTKN
ncbi:uncharacterized protein isoform X1 [Rhodnius prolixus]|uniref:uncharacterized protein isoform X1 n=1 Tax=Rhodnius prolixus TaxID=13249 RepID=UPI003D1894D0